MNKNNWQTPADVLDAVRGAFGGCIDLDPCSTAAANQRVQAMRFSTLAEDGTAADWAGAVWCNPPFGKEHGKPLPEPFAKRMAEHWDVGLPGIFIMNSNAVTAKWATPLRQRCSHLVVPGKRIHFINPETGRPETAPPGGCVLLAGGPLAQPDVLARLGAVFGKQCNLIEQCIEQCNLVEPTENLVEQVQPCRRSRERKN